MNRAKDETTAALLAAAHRLLAEDGPDALTVRRLATEAGMSTMNVYSRFGGKDGVLDELYADGFRRLLAEIDVVPSTDDIGEDLLNVANAYRGFALSNPTYYTIMFRSTVPGFEPSPESIELAHKGPRALAERIRLGQKRGRLVTPESFVADDMASFLWATCHGLVSLELEDAAGAPGSWSTIFHKGMIAAIAGLRPSATHAAAT